MARPKSFRNPTRVSLTLNRQTLAVARRLARRARRSVSEIVSEILEGHFRPAAQSPLPPPKIIPREGLRAAGRASKDGKPQRLK